MSERMTDQDCAICDVAARTHDETIVFRSDAFTVVPAPAEVPGWFLFWTNRHDANGLWDLTAGEAAEFGLLSRDLAGAARETTGAERAYLMSFGEHALHFHAMVLARTAEMPQDARGAGLLAQGARFADPPRARTVTAEVRARLGYPPSRSEHLPS
jgi:diadenosine tetraphosphate (Ap4A) HIT family hydrolase